MPMVGHCSAVISLLPGKSSVLPKRAARVRIPRQRERSLAGGGGGVAPLVRAGLLGLCGGGGHTCVNDGGGGLGGGGGGGVQGAARRSKSAPHMHVPVCICSYVRQFQSNAPVIHLRRRLFVHCLAVFCQPKSLACILLTGAPSPCLQVLALWLALRRPDLLGTVGVGMQAGGRESWALWGLISSRGGRHAHGVAP